jgi:trans-aconitate methyltransferase
MKSIKWQWQHESGESELKTIQLLYKKWVPLQCERQWNKYFKDFSFPYGFYSPKDYEPLLEEVGFKVQCLELKPKTMVHEDIEKFKGWIRTTWLPYLHRVPKDLRNSFINLIAAKYIEKYMSNSDGRVEILMQRLEFIAIK